MVNPVKTAKLQQTQPIVDSEGRPSTAFMRLINGNTDNLAYALNQILLLPQIQDALAALDVATAAAQAAAAAANGAAGDAAAQAAAAQAQADAQAREAALVNSYIDPGSVLSSSPTTISIMAHTRIYGDGTSAPVNAGSVAATATGDTDYVFYSDPARGGGPVTYQVSTDAPVQGGDIHVVGAVTIPAAGTQPGGQGPRAPGYVQP